MQSTAAESVYAALKLDDLHIGELAKKPIITWLHLVTDEHSANFRSRKLLEATYSDYPRHYSLRSGLVFYFEPYL